ncbi:uncharacterized protein [Embiotoca jacksoni]|uniref:uncharacterized protein n=1 Tax=Embiotoca jacksoni TaxID=100190 RepID=UPI00370494D1
MGQTLSPEEKMVELDKYSRVVFNSQHWPAIGIDIDSSLQRFSGLNSSAVLNEYRDSVIYDDLSQVASAVEKLGTALGELSMVPGAVGLGALVISLVLETVAHGFQKTTMGTAEMLERVFAHQKSNEVRDLMDEYLKRLRINLGNQQLQLSETRQIETDLSFQLTRLKNTMLRDGQMNSQFLKQWVNGAAFHTQMLIHQARLEGTTGNRATQAAGIYQQQLNLLLGKYKDYLKTVIVVHIDSNRIYLECCVAYRWITNNRHELRCFQLKENYCMRGSAVVDVMFTKRQITWAKTYFSDLQANIPTLVTQNDVFHVRN